MTFNTWGSPMPYPGQQCGVRAAVMLPSSVEYCRECNDTLRDGPAFNDLNHPRNRGLTKAEFTYALVEATSGVPRPHAGYYSCPQCSTLLLVIIWKVRSCPSCGCRFTVESRG